MIQVTSNNGHSTNILDNILEGCQIIDFDWKYIYVNNAMINQIHKTKDDILNHSVIECFPGIENTKFFSILNNCMTNRVSSKMTNEFIFPDGSKGWFELCIEPVPEGIFILSIDITLLIQANNDILQQNNKLKALREIDLAILGSSDLKITLKTVLREFANQLNIDAVDILLLNPHTKILEFSVGYGFRSDAIEKTKLHLNESFAGQAALEQKSFYINDLSKILKDFIRADLIKYEEFTSYYVVPLISRGRILGVIDIFHRSPINPTQSWIDFLEALAGQASMAIDSCNLLQNLNHTNLDLLLAYDTTIEGWSRALDLRDKETEGHSVRVTDITIDLARHFDLTDSEINNIRYGALLHDIGKMGIPDHILLKQGKLTEEEFTIMQKHCEYGYELLYPIKYLRSAIDIPYCHHEKWDGTGYPRKLKDEQIPLPARMFAIVDVWDALVSDRPYRKAWPEEKAIEHIYSQSGKHFDPNIVSVFFEVIKKRK